MITEVIVSGAIGLFSGVAGSLFTPWAQWGIEKRKIKYKKRGELIADVKNYINNHCFNYCAFKYTEIYPQIKPFLDKNINDQIEAYLLDGNIGNISNNSQRLTIMDNLYRLEKKWNLI